MWISLTSLSTSAPSVFRSQLTVATRRSCSGRVRTNNAPMQPSPKRRKCKLASDWLKSCQPGSLSRLDGTVDQSGEGGERATYKVCRNLHEGIVSRLITNTEAITARISESVFVFLSFACRCCGVCPTIVLPPFLNPPINNPYPEMCCRSQGGMQQVRNA